VADIWTKRKRSEVMALIRSRGNKNTELRLRDVFRVAGITGWRRHQPLPGRPDFVFRKERLAVFVDGCFWHGCARCYRRPSSNRVYWDAKVQRNRARDMEVCRELRRRGWRVLRIWEHELKGAPAYLRRLRRALEPKRK
jgi:DNA mismatch endonuclease (patch repair protein)